MDQEEIEKDIDDPALLAKQAQQTAEKQANDLRAAHVEIQVEPPTTYRP